MLFSLEKTAKSLIQYELDMKKYSRLYQLNSMTLLTAFLLASWKDFIVKMSCNATCMDLWLP